MARGERAKARSSSAAPRLQLRGRADGFTSGTLGSRPTAAASPSHATTTRVPSTCSGWTARLGECGQIWRRSVAIRSSPLSSPSTLRTSRPRRACATPSTAAHTARRRIRSTGRICTTTARAKQGKFIGKGDGPAASTLKIGSRLRPRVSRWLGVDGSAREARWGLGRAEGARKDSMKGGKGRGDETKRRRARRRPFPDGWIGMARDGWIRARCT